MSCCVNSFELCDSLPSCLTQLVIKTPIISDDVVLEIIDKFNTIYKVSKTSDSEGKIIIQLQDDDPEVADLPIGLFNEFAGKFKLILNGESWEISETQYTVLIVEFANIIPVVDSFELDPTYLNGIVGTYNL